MVRSIALTVGDPLGIGPEITLKALQQRARFGDVHFVVCGSLLSLKAAAEKLGMDLPAEDSRLRYQPVENEMAGSAAFFAIKAAAAILAGGEADVMVTGPISKQRLQEAGHAFSGHTEILEDLAVNLFKAEGARAEMLFLYRKFRLLLLTRHIALKDVASALAEKGAVARPLKTLISFLRHKAGIDEPHIALLAVNPHGGETGVEEKQLIMPVIHAVNAIGASQLSGPFPADAFFRGFDAEQTSYDAVVAMYHDQGLIPFKLLAGYEAVNVTIGLPFLRFSVSHGTADDIAGKGIASESSLCAAIETALSFVKPRNA